MSLLTADQRRRKAELEREIAEIMDASNTAAREKRRAERKAMIARRGKIQKVNHLRAKPKGGRERDAGFMTWQHESGLACIACVIEGRPDTHGEPNPIEVAHQRVSGWKKGVRGNDADSCPLCRSHHQLAPNACDKGQRAFWARLGVDPAAYVTALHSAYLAGQDGRDVLATFTRRG